MNKLEENIRTNIHAELSRVTAANSPEIYAVIQTPDGYAKVEKRIIEVAIRESMPVQAVLPIVETELSGS